jgi:hypothetical protein
VSYARAAFAVAVLALAATGVGASADRVSARVQAPAREEACRDPFISAVIAGRQTCIGEWKPCKKRLDRAYHRYLFHCHRGSLRIGWDLLRRRPLRVPTIPAGAPCPAATSSAAAASVGLQKSFTFRVWGPGPAYPFIGGDDHAELVFELPMRDPVFGTEWGGTKAIWGISLQYSGPVLVRGRQLDGPNIVRFENGRPGFTDAKRRRPDAELRLTGPEPHGNPATTRLRAPGCYAYQVDGRAFSYLIVFEARISG